MLPGLVDHTAHDLRSLVPVEALVLLILVTQFFEKRRVFDLDEILVLRQNTSLIEDLGVLVPVADEALSLLRELPVLALVYIEEPFVRLVVPIAPLVEHQLRVVDDSGDSKLVLDLVSHPSDTELVLGRVHCLLMLHVPELLTKHEMLS